MGIQYQKFNFGQTLEKGKLNSCVKQLETRLCKRKMKNFNSWYFNNYKSSLGNSVLLKYIPATSTFTGKIARKCITIRDGEKKSPKLLGSLLWGNL